MTTNNAVNTTLAGQSGTGKFVGNTSPLLVTPSMDQINDPTYLLKVLGLTGNAAAINSINIANAVTNGDPHISAVGSDTNIFMTLLGKGNAGVQVAGSTNGAMVNTGYIGEELTVNIPSGSAVSLTTATAATVATLPITPGIWACYANVNFSASIAMLFGLAWTDLTASALPNGSKYGGLQLATEAIVTLIANVPFVVYSVSVNSNIYLRADSSFSAGTNVACGNLTAVRIG